MKQAQEYPGHKNLQTTFRYCVYLMKENKIATAEAMEGFPSLCSGK